MRDFRDAKAMAQTLRDALKVKGVSLTHSDSLELVASILGFHDWNTLAAKLQSERNSPNARQLPAGSRARKSSWTLQYLIATLDFIYHKTTTSLRLRATGIDCSRVSPDN